MATLPTLALGTFTNVANTQITGTPPVLQLIASAADASYVFTNNNGSGTFVDVAQFALADMPADFGNMDTLAVRLRYLRGPGTITNPWDSLTARVFRADGTTPLTNTATVVNGPITTTTATNSGVVTFTGLDTTANKAVWDGAVVRIYFTVTRSMGGDTLEKRVTAAELTGTYSLAPGVLDQSAWRWRGDDGSETGASWLAATDTAGTFNIGSGNVNVRLRLALTETLGTARTAVAPQLQMGVEGGEPEEWTQRTSSFDTTIIRLVVYANGIWVAGGDLGKLATATDPTGTWTQRASSFDTTIIYAIAYANGIWVAGGASGLLATATDPTGTWTQRTSSFGTSTIRSVAYDNGVWVAVGGAGKLATATDPTGTWTQQVSSFAPNEIIGGIAYGNNAWAAVTHFGNLATATDPTGTWTQQTSSFDTTAIQSIAYGNGVWVAVASFGKLATGNAFWNTITTSSSPVRAFDSSNLTHGGNTTQQITSGTFVSSNAGVSETGTAGPTTFAGSDRAEYEFTVTFLAASLADGDQILFRLV
jgi:hypothetical protein